MRLTRRTVTVGGAASVLALGGLGATVGPASALTAVPDAAWLQATLDALCKTLDGRTRVALNDVIVTMDQGPGVVVDLSLNLVWAPGERIVPYRAQGQDPAAAFRGLRDQIARDLVALHRPASRGQVHVDRA